MVPLGPLMDLKSLFPHFATAIGNAMSSNGDNQTNLTNNPATDANVSWSPDGTKLVFTSWRDGENVDEIYVMNPDGSNQRRLTYNAVPGGDGYPAWSPDGSRIAFTSHRDRWTEIYVMNADGSNQRRLTRLVAGAYFSSWSPDGSQIAFASDHYWRTNYHGDENVAFNMDIYVIGVDGGEPVRLTRNDEIDTTPAWSPIP